AGGAPAATAAAGAGAGQLQLPQQPQPWPVHFEQHPCMIALLPVRVLARSTLSGRRGPRIPPCGRVTG
ncbi:hypothetical protein H480_36915, partial [Amycolatopsis vancoresmycina DSM 44592]